MTKAIFPNICMLVLLVMTSCKKEKNRICQLYESNVGYSVGTIQSYHSSPFKVVYDYDFSVNGNLYSGEERGYGIGQEDDGLLGKEFIVIYELDDPTNNDLNSDFYIESVADYQDFLNKYASTPPPPDFPNKCK